MKDAQGKTMLGRTRWKRFAAIMVPSVAATGGIAVAVAQGAIAASFAVSGAQFTVSVQDLEGTGFEQFGATVKDSSGHTMPVIEGVISDAQLNGLCQSVVQNVPLVGPVTMTLTAGNKGTPAHATNLVLDLTNLQGQAVFTNVNIGQDAGTMNAAGVAGPTGGFGQQASKISIKGAYQTAWATTAGTFQLSGLNVSLSLGSHPCPNPNA